MAQRRSPIGWATTVDPTERTEPARKGFNRRFEKLVDPDGKLPPDERAKRAHALARARRRRT